MLLHQLLSCQWLNIGEFLIQRTFNRDERETLRHPSLENRQEWQQNLLGIFLVVVLVSGKLSNLRFLESLQRIILDIELLPCGVFCQSDQLVEGQRLPNDAKFTRPLRKVKSRYDKTCNVKSIC